MTTLETSTQYKAHTTRLLIIREQRLLISPFVKQDKDLAREMAVIKKKMSLLEKYYKK